MEQRYFIVIVPLEEICAEVLQLKNEFVLKYNSKGALRSPAHITLHMPFLWKEEKENGLVDTLAHFKYETGSSITLHNYSHFGDRVIFIDISKNKELEDMQKQLVRYVKVNLRLFNQDGSLRGFHPHMTVAGRDRKKQHGFNAWEEFKNRSFHAEFQLKNFSLLKHDGKQWNVLRTFMLND